MRDRIDEVEDRLEIDELFIRAFMILGVTICALATLAAFVSGNRDVLYGYGILTLFATAVLVVGWYYERAAAGMMGIAAVAAVLWGVSLGWDLALWIMVGITLIVPLVIGAAMFYYEDREEEVIEHAQATVPTRAVHA